MNIEAITDYSGIRKVMKVEPLGELEAQILDIVWDIEPPVNSTQVFKIMYPRRGISYPTISQTMEKLAKKGILTQERQGETSKSPFVYTPIISRDEMGVSLLDAVSRQVLGKPLDEGITMLCGGKVDAKGIERLREMVAQDEAV